MSDTPETDAFRDNSFTDRVDEMDELYGLAEKLERERDKARNLVKSGIRAQASLNEALDKTLYDLRMAREQIRELIYIAERAIALAEIDYENDKFGVVSELREALKQIKKAAK